MSAPAIAPGESALQAASASPRHVPAITLIAYAALVVLAWVALELWGLGSIPFHTKGEPREGLVVWEMTHGGGWILPRRNGVELPSKPPLFHWLSALTSLAHGDTDEWSIRFPSAALSLAALLCEFAAAAALWSPRAGLLSALTLMTMFEWARAATNARVDMTLTFGLLLAFLGLLFFLRTRTTRWLVPLYAGITLAVLGKGPVGAALPGLVAVMILALTRDASFLRRMRLGYGTLSVAVLAGSWYVLALLLGGWEFFRKQVLAENVFTFFNDPDFSGGHRHSVLYLFGALLVGVLPWTPCLAGALARQWRQRRELSRTDPRTYLLVWSLVVFGFYAIAASKRSVYLLAMYPALALFLGWWWDEQIRSPSEERWLGALVRALAVVALAICVVMSTLVGLESVGVPLVATGARWLPAVAQPFAPQVSLVIYRGCWPLLGCLALAGVALYTTARATSVGRWSATFAGLFVATAFLYLAAQHVVIAGIARAETLRDFMAEVRSLVGPTQDLSFYNTFDYEAVFYWRGHIPQYTGTLPDHAPLYLLLQQDDWMQAPAAVKAQYEQMHVSDEHGELVLIRRVPTS